MSRLPRPSIPLAVKLTVARRQLGDSADEIAAFVQVAKENRSLGSELEHSLAALAEKLECPRDQLRLDHDPALENREKLVRLPNGQKQRVVIVPDGAEIIRYFPDANDPEYLFYRPHGPQFDGSHLVKTNTRGPHGQHSDRALAAKNKNIVKNRDPKRRKTKIKQRSNFKWPSRPFQKRKNKKGRSPGGERPKSVGGVIFRPPPSR